MGVGGSQLEDSLGQILIDEPMNTLLTEEIHQLTYEQFLEFLKELNLLSKKYLGSDGNQLIFAVKKDTDSTVFWKATVQIACVKLNTATQKVETFKLLSLSELLKVFKTFKCQVSAMGNSDSASGLSDMTVSSFLDKLDLKAKSDSSEEITECCICFERKQEVILPCAHSYCLPCIEEWNETHDTCPICREKLDSTDDTWVLSEVPKPEEVSKEIRNNLMELTNERSSSCNPS